MKILTSKEMKKIDNITINEIGIPGCVLMENAGIQIYKAIKKKFPELKKEKISIIAGPGNNGGDGLVVARHLFNEGIKPEIYLLASREKVKGDAGINLKIAEKIGLKIQEVNSEKIWNIHKEKISNSTLIIDAIFGTGLTRPVEGLFKRVIEDINEIKAFKIAIDIPSGLSSDTYQIIGPCVKADLTVTLGAPKIAHIFPPTEEYIGELIIADISIPPFLFENKNLKLELIDKNAIISCFEPRKKDTHKGTYGHLFILAGSLGKTGAAIMAGKSALKIGAGLVTIGTPQSCLPIIARSMMELMTEPLAETEKKTLSEKALEEVLILSKDKDALLIGPGITTHPSTSNLILNILEKIDKPVVIDADGLNILASRPEVLKNVKNNIVLTPHPGEFARLLKKTTKEILKNKIEYTREFATKYNVYLVLKGYKTLIATPEGNVFVNPTGNPGMATAGSGDVLSGILGGLIIQQKNFLNAILAGIYVHGLSGDIASQKIGEKSLIARDLITYLPKAIKLLEKSFNE
ncbi:NAD(P)H-hydrate dehydratase [Candidatus Aminicenantes bacterium AH-873-B07]|nr:NAD(P)H-hydrate dehydratase [Candidatus Aminicenantes bacterium AH-873-B07]